MRDTAASDRKTETESRKVWDLLLRLIHWGLVVSVATALISGFLLDASWVRLHIAAGTLAGALVALRIIWGFTGPTYARFAQFLPRPGTVLAHLRTPRQHARHIGHNPLGALMVVALLAVALGLVGTGVALLGSSLKTGPLAFALPATQGRAWSERHELLALVILSLIVLHIGGVLYESLASRENLARAMVTGRKPARAGDLVSQIRPALNSLTVMLAGSLFAGLSTVTAGLMAKAPQNPPAATMPDLYEAECAACHMAHHPSLRPAASWALMMDNLADHFGEDARLSQTDRDQITAWLSANAAEAVDSKPALIWRSLSEATPIALPETPGWERLHAGLDDAVLKRRAVYSRSNCAACHRDSESGWFSPFNISIPKETQ